MTNQRLISDARRHAKRLARVSGRPHQHHLDEIAVLAGARDWAGYLASPTPLPVMDREHEADRDEDACPAESHATAQAMPDRMPYRQKLLLAAGIAVACLMTVIPLGDRHLVDAVIWTSGTLLLAAVLPTTWRTLRDGLVGNQPVKGSWPQTHACMMSIVTVVAMAAVFYGRNLPGPDVIDAVDQDRMHARTMRLLPDMPHMPIAGADRVGRRARVTVVLADGRLGGPSFRWAFNPTQKVGGARLQAAYQNNPVIRGVVDADCALGTYVITGFEAARSYRSPAAFRYDVAEGGTRRRALPAVSRSMLCGVTV